MKKPNGFTLIELLIVVVLSGLLILAAVSLFFTSIVGNEKTSASLLVKQNGDYAITQMGRLIRNARSATCPAADTLVLAGNDGGSTTLTVQTVGTVNKIASNSGYLTGNDVSVTSGTLQFSCLNPTDGSPSFVRVSFTLQKGASGDRGYASLPFSTSVGLRTY